MKRIFYCFAVFVAVFAVVGLGRISSPLAAVEWPSVAVQPTRVFDILSDSGSNVQPILASFFGFNDRRLIRGKVSPSALRTSCPKRKLIGVTGFRVPQKIVLTQKADVQKTLALATADWVEKVVQPAARRHFGSSVVELRVAAAFACRTRNNRPGAKLSEHGYGNAIDISAFTLANGREVHVASGWRGKPAEQRFLVSVHKGGCHHFTTVLGPNADKYHYDHFHFDLAHRGRYGKMRICR